MPSVRTTVAVAITVVWIGGFVATLINPMFATLAAQASPIMVLVGAWLFDDEIGKEPRRGRRSENGKARPPR